MFYGMVFMAQVGILAYLYIKWDEMPVRSRWGITAAGTLMGVLVFVGIIILNLIVVIGIFASLFGG